MMRVELFAEGLSGEAPVVRTMSLAQRLGVDAGLYSISIEATRPMTDFTVRMVPCFPDVAAPLENAHIFWQGG